jgi:hypothetical protein
VAKAPALGLEGTSDPSGRRAGEPATSGPLPKDLEGKRKEAEALARFLLENLS